MQKLLVFYGIDSLFSLLLGLPLLTLVWTPFLGLSVFFLIRPYIELLSQSLIVPTKLILRIVWNDLRKVIVACEQMAQMSQWNELEISIPAVRSHVEYFSAMNENTTFGKDVSPKLIAKFNTDRRKLYDSMLNTSRLRELLVSGTLAPSSQAELNSLLDQLDHER